VEISSFRTRKLKVIFVVVVDVEEMSVRTRETAGVFRSWSHDCDISKQNFVLDLRQCFNLRSQRPARRLSVFRHGVHQCLMRADPDLQERKLKNTNNRSLRYQVEKWLAPPPVSTVHVTEFGRTRWDRTPYVCVETSSPTGVRMLLFFRHRDGTWNVFPPAIDRQKSTTQCVAV